MINYRFIMIPVVLSALVFSSGCKSSMNQARDTEADSRPIRFEIKVDVQGNIFAPNLSIERAKYLIDQHGNLYISMAEDDEHPLIVKKLNQEQFDRVWELVNELDPEDYRSIRGGSGPTFTIVEFEINTDDRNDRMYMVIGKSTPLVDMLTELAWTCDW